MGGTPSGASGTNDNYCVTPTPTGVDVLWVELVRRHRRTAAGRCERGDGLFTGTNELNDDQTFNVVNELTARDTDDDGTDEYSLVYDAAGNLTDDDKDYEYIYDAWGRLVEVQNQSQQTVAEFTYNGLGYRTGWHYDVDGNGTVEANASSTPDDPWFQFVYDTSWRVTATYRASRHGSWTIDGSPPI